MLAINPSQEKTTTQSELAGLLNARRKDTNRRQLLLDGISPLRYSTLVQRAACLVTFLKDRNCGIGDRAVIVTADDAVCVELFTGLAAAGVTAVLLNPDGAREELELLIEAADASLIFADENVLQTTLAARASDQNTVCIRKSTKSWFGRRATAENATHYPAVVDGLAEAPFPEIPAETIAYILFTSGTTSQPKGVEISHRALFSQMRTFRNHYGLTRDTRLLNILPFHHTDGLTHGAIVAFTAGATLVRPMRFRIDKLPQLVDAAYKKRVTHFITVPSMLALIRQLGDDYTDAYNYDEFEFVISTAAYLDEKLWTDFESRFGVRVVNVYGLTETVCEACYSGPDDESFRHGTVGRPVDCEVAVFDDHRNPLAAGETGELGIRGANVMSGYFRMPEATAAVMHNGWFLTGDLATLDKHGLVTIVGRKKSVIISSGYNIYPEDVTRVLCSIDGVVDAVTFGVADDTWGEKAVACVIVEKESQLTSQSLAATFLERASYEKLPREIHLVDSLPRGPAGKVLLDEVRKLVEGHETDVSSNSSTKEALLTIATASFALDPETISLDIGPDSATGWTSLAHVEFLMTLEKSFGFKLAPRDIMRINSLQAALDVVREKTRQ